MFKQLQFLIKACHCSKDFNKHFRI